MAPKHICHLLPCFLERGCSNMEHMDPLGASCLASMKGLHVIWRCLAWVRCPRLLRRNMMDTLNCEIVTWEFPKSGAPNMDENNRISHIRTPNQKRNHPFIEILTRIIARLQSLASNSICFVRVRLESYPFLDLHTLKPTFHRNFYDPSLYRE